MSTARIAAGIAATAILLCATTLPATAHPHVWIVAWSDVVFDDRGRIVAINVEWEFDEFYSTVAIEGLDANGDGKYASSELQELAADNMRSLADFNFLMAVEVDGEAVALGPVAEFGSNHRDPHLTLHFQVTLSEPVDPGTQTFSYRMYDPTFYIAVDLENADAVTIIGAAPDACGVRIEKGEGNTEEAQQQPETFYENLMAAQDLGSLYADTIFVTCNGDAQS